MENLVKSGLAILLLLCLTDMPYGYYQLVRFIATAVFIYLAALQKTTGSELLFFIYLLLAALFQPFLKVSLGRQVWNVADVAVAVFLLATVFMQKPKQ